jgi:hypothetical protein
MNNNHEISEMNRFKLIDMSDLKSALAIMTNTEEGESNITTSILKDSAEVIADRFIDLGPVYRKRIKYLIRIKF